MSVKKKHKKAHVLFKSTLYDPCTMCKSDYFFQPKSLIKETKNGFAGIINYMSGKT